LSTVISSLTEAMAGLFQLRWRTLRRGLGELLLHPQESLEPLQAALGSLKSQLPSGTDPLDAATVSRATRLGVMSPQQSTTAEELGSRIDALTKQLEQQKKRTRKWAESWSQVQKNPRIQTLFKETGVFGARGPSYMPPRIVVLSLLDTLAPADPGKSGDRLAQAKHLVQASTCPPALKVWLQDALEEAKDDRDKLLVSLEKSFDRMMDRVSGWYKRTATIFVLVFAAIIVGVVNVDSYAIGQRLWQDAAVRNTLVAQAGKANAASPCPAKGATGATGAAGQQDANPYQTIATCISTVKQLGLPFGWASENRGHSAGEWFGKAGGWIVTVFALMLGAPFWFDTLGKLAHLRTTGNREGTTKDGDRAAIDRDEP
jgi:hypothetical protein